MLEPVWVGLVTPLIYFLLTQQKTGFQVLGTSTNSVLVGPKVQETSKEKEADCEFKQIN